ncbi:hypothetical protein R1sor_026433 [Riccia sorocarpa]|uniref:Endonuclease/exonuclease/phosphatase domain-containing protein n=1 Tax=Riccia sorocarpa TaxID=122646 RepID=A0ABD3GBE7_9MARC
MVLHNSNTPARTKQVWQPKGNSHSTTPHAAENATRKSPTPNAAGPSTVTTVACSNRFEALLEEAGDEVEPTQTTQLISGSPEQTEKENHDNTLTQQIHHEGEVRLNSPDTTLLQTTQTQSHSLWGTEKGERPNLNLPQTPDGHESEGEEPVTQILPETDLTLVTQPIATPVRSTEDSSEAADIHGITSLHNALILHCAEIDNHWITPDDTRTPSPMELMIVAKKRALMNRQVSPHEELLPDEGRTDNHIQIARDKAAANRSLMDDRDSPGIFLTPQQWQGAAQIVQRAQDQQLWRGQDSSSTPRTDELKVRNKQKLQLRLEAIITGGKVYVDYTASGRGGAALIIPLEFQVVDYGSSGTGNAIWVSINTAVGPVKVISIHTPNTKEERTTFWDRLEDIIGEGPWILAGDFNMVDLPDDSRGKTAHIAGAEARCWKEVCNRKGLIDAYLTAVNKTGGNFTCQAFCGRRFDRARLDRFYFSEAADWLEVIDEVQHRSEQVVSDHLPVILNCTLKQDSRRLDTKIIL